MFWYRVPQPDEAMLLRGWRVDGNRVVENGAVVIPFLRQATCIPLAPPDVEVEQTCYDSQRVEMVVTARVSVRVDDPEKAGRRYARDPERMRARVRGVFGERIARVAGTRPVEQIAISNREDFADEVIEMAEREMTKIGLACEGLSLDVRDKEGYIDQLGSQKRAALAGMATYARVHTDLQNYLRLGKLYQQAQLPDGRSVAEAAAESLDRVAALADPSNGGVR